LSHESCGGCGNVRVSESSRRWSPKMQFLRLNGHHHVHGRDGTPLPRTQRPRQASLFLLPAGLCLPKLRLLALQPDSARPAGAPGLLGFGPACPAVSLRQHTLPDQLAAPCSLSYKLCCSSPTTTRHSSHTVPITQCAGANRSRPLGARQRNGMKQKPALFYAILRHIMP
jgi:hypothetical protein